GVGGGDGVTTCLWIEGMLIGMPLEWSMTHSWKRAPSDSSMPAARQASTASGFVAGRSVGTDASGPSPVKRSTSPLNTSTRQLLTYLLLASRSFASWA